jgi:hypothetical protein
MRAGKNVTSDPGSIITAAGRDGGGTVKLRAGDTTILRGEISVVGTSESAKGGQVQLLGERVGLFDQAKVDASGGAGGGEVLVGGDYQGKNREIPNALRTFVSKDSSLSADATTNGDGGRIIVWADDWTKFYGKAEVNGFFNGGFIEISGKQFLDFEGAVSALGAYGKIGTVLFDPVTLTIVAGAGVTGGVTGNAVPPAGLDTSTLFSDSGVAGTLGNITLNNALSSANVEVLASDDMDVNAAVTVPAGRILTLTGNDVTIDASISGSGTLDLNFSGTVSQTAAVSVSNLVLRSNTVNLNTILNDVDNFAVTTGTVSFFDSDALNISSLAYKGGTANGIESATTVEIRTGGNLTQSAPVGDSGNNKSVGTFRAGAFGAGDILLGNDINDVDNLSLRTEGGTALAPDEAPRAAFIRFDERDGFVMQNWTIGALAGGIVTAKGGTTTLPTGGSVVLGAGQGPDDDPPVTQAAGARILTSNLGLLGRADYTLTDTANDIYTLATNLTNAGDLSYTDLNGFQVFYVNFDPFGTDNDVFIPGIQLAGRGTDPYTGGNLTLLTQAGGEYDGIQLTATGFVSSPNGTVTIARTITAANQYNLLASFTGEPGPGHVEASGDVLITVQNTAGTDFTNRFTLQEGIHLFAGMNPGLTGFGNGGNVTITADNMTIGADTRPDLAMHGIIMTGNPNEAAVVPFATGTFLAPFTAQRQSLIVTPKADYALTPDPGELQLTQAELRRVNSNRLQISSLFVDATQPAVDVRTPLSLFGLYDTVEISGIFPTNPGVNRLELIAFGGTDSNVQISADVSSDANQLPMDIFLSAANALQTAGGVVNVNAGLRSYGGQIGIQGQNVNLNAAVNAGVNGLVAIFPGADNTAINLGTKGVGLGILRSELALITANTVQIGDVELRPWVLSPVNPFTLSSIVGTDPLWKNGIQANNSGAITVSDLISGLSFDTLALVTPGGVSQSAQAGLQVPGLFVVGNPAATTTDYVLGGAFNEIDRLAVILGLATATGAPSGDLLLVNQKGLIAGNGAEVAQIGQQWDQGYTRTTTAPYISTGVGLVVARALSITAKGSVSIYETMPAGLTGLGYIGHVSSNPNSANGAGYAQVGNQIGLVGDATSGLAINVIGSASGETGANDVWAAAARGLSINDLTTEFAVAAEAGIVTNGGQVTLEGNAIEIVPIVSRVATSAGNFSLNTITIDTTGALDSTTEATAAATAIAPAGARVTIRPATGQNGFQDRLGSGAFDPGIENSPLAGAPVEMNLGTTSIGAGTTFLNASLGTVFIGNLALAGTAIRASVLEIGRNTNPGTATGRFSITANIGAAGNTMSTLLGEVHLISGGAVEDSGMVIPGGAGPFTITTNLNNSAGNGGLAVEALGAIALQGNVASFAADAGANNNVRFIDTGGGVSIGVVDEVSGILANTFYLSVTGSVGQASGATIQASLGGISVQSTGAIRLDQENDFNLVAAYSSGTVVSITPTVGGSGATAIPVINPSTGAITGYTVLTGGSGYTGANVAISGSGNLAAATATVVAGVITAINVTAEGSGYGGFSPIYLRSAGPMTVNTIAAGQPGGRPAGVVGITGSNVTLVAGGDLRQSDLATISATTFSATVLDGSDVFLEASGNNFGPTPIIGALTQAGAIGNVRNLSIFSNSALELGSAGMMTVDITSAGSGWTTAPTLTVSSGSVAAVMGLQSIAVSAGGAGYQAAPALGPRRWQWWT